MTEIKKNKFSLTPPELNGLRHIQGLSKFIADEIKPQGMLYIAIFHSKYAHAHIISINTEIAKNIKGIKTVLTAKDIPGENQIGHLMADEPLLAEDLVNYIGQPIALVVAESPRLAELGVKAIEISYNELTPILTIEEALKNDNLYIPPRVIECGDLKKGMKNSPHIISGKFKSGAQEHFYMETQRSRAIMGDHDEIIISSATQSSSEVQEITAKVLGLSSKDITVDIKRLGGAFGGKERNATLFACLTAFACFMTKKPVELVLNRLEDIECTGKRHPFESKYTIGFDDNGKILAYDVEFCSNGGASIDLSVAILERAMLHADNAYYIPNARIIGKACRTNLPPNTAFRGFGAPQGILVIENAIHRIARFLNKDPQEIRCVNAYKEEQFTPFSQPVLDAPEDYYIKKCLIKSNYSELINTIKEFNSLNLLKKRGIALIPIKFGISFTTAFLNQGSALIWIYTDGTISVSHGGVEMGQSLNTKVALIVADTLGVSLGRIRIESSNTKRIGNASPTAASSGTDINGSAARIAAEKIKLRLSSLALKELNLDDVSDIVFKDDQVSHKNNPDLSISFENLIHKAYLERIDLGAHGYYSTPGIFFDREKGKGTPFYYFVYGSALVEAEIDLVHGNFSLPKVYIVHETGKSLNQNIDKGQITGAFIQGLGWCTMEEENFDSKGRYLALTPSTYKFPTIRDIPQLWDIELVEKDCKANSVLGSKALGEPPLIYGEAVWFAIKDAIESINNYNIEAELSHPATPEAILLAVEKIKQKF